MPFLAPIVAGIGAAVTAVGSFLGAVPAALGGLGFFGKALLSIGLNLAMSVVQSALARKNQKPPPSGVDLELQFGEGVSRKVMCGYCYQAGHFVYPNAYGPANQTLQQAFELSDFPITSLDKVYIDGEEVTLGAEDATKGFVVSTGEYAGRIWIKLHDGRQTEADPGLVDNANAEERWTEDHVGLGNAYVIVTMNYDREKLTQPPQFLFGFEGAPLYDWRKDDTAGGDGDHRWDDITTWEYTENPILMAYAYHRGISINGDLFCGMEVPESDLPLAKWTLAANVCDETVEGAARYRCSIGLDCNIEHGDNIEAILTSCGGILVRGVGEVSIIVGTDQEAVATLTDDDLIVGEPVLFQKRRSMGDLVNSVSGTYPNRENQGNPTGYQAARDEGTVTADRRSRDVSMNFPTVGDGNQAGRLAAIYLSENRFGATATITVRPRWQVLEPGDWIVWDSARYGEHTFMVVEMEIMSDGADGPRNTVLSLQERSGDIYESVDVVVPTPPLGPATPVYAAELQDFAVTAAIGVGADGRAYPMIRTSWSAPTDPTVSRVVLEWRVAAQPDDILDRTITIDRTVALLTEGIVSETGYQVRHRLIADPPRPTTASAWQDVTTLSAPSSDVTVGLGQTRTDIYGLLATLRQQTDDLAATIELAGGNAAIDTADAYLKREQVKRTVGALSAAVTKETQARIEGDAAIASDLTLVEAKADDATAAGLFKIEAAAGSGDVLSRLTLYARATTGDAFEDAGMVIEVITDGEIVPTLTSRVVIKAAQFVVTDGTEENYPLVYEAGELKLAIGNIGKVIAGVIQDVENDPDVTFRITPADGSIDWFDV